MKIIVSAVIAACLLSGCATTKIGARSYYDANRDNGIQTPGSRVFIWDSDYSAGIGNSRGQCAQGALTATATSLGAAIDVIGKAKAGLDVAQSIETVNVSSVETAYANLGYFYLCQILLNENGNIPAAALVNAETSEVGQRPRLTGAQIQSMFNNVGLTATSLRGQTGEVRTVLSPKLTAALKKLYETFPNPTEDQIKNVLEGGDPAAAPATDAVPAEVETPAATGS